MCVKKNNEKNTSGKPMDKSVYVKLQRTSKGHLKLITSHNILGMYIFTE